MHKEKALGITKIIIQGVLLSGGVAVACTSPYFLSRVLPRIMRYARYQMKNKSEEKSFRRTFSYLRSQGFIKIEKKNGQIYISLTEEGKKKAGKYQINDLQIKKPKKWDKQWRILIFDIKDKQRIKREALRGKIKELGLFQLQKSVWVYPYDFYKEMEMLRSFFALTKDEVQFIVANEIENDGELKKIFKLS